MSAVRDMTTANAAAGIITKKRPDKRGSRRKSLIVNRSRLYLILLLLMFPTLAGMLLFTYYPQWETIKYSLFKWDGQFERDFVGLRNFRRALSGADVLFWPTFQLVGILLVANLVKMVPSILTAVILHRVKSDRWQYIYRVLFVIPMIIPGLVTLLIWKQFFDSTTGILNVTLNGTGLMGVLQWLDQVMPSIATTLKPAVDSVTSFYGSVWGLALMGTMIMAAPATFSGYKKQALGWGILLVIGLLLWWNHPVAFINAIAFSLLVTLGRSGRVKLEKTTGSNPFMWVGLAAIVIASVLVLFGMIWTAPTKSFDNASPAWLGESKLIIPSLVFWGFPWVGTVGVLIYLAGLQNISADVYEAAEIDGLGSIGKFFSIELPLILTQVRINLIFMTIGTLTDYYLIFLLLGPDGGPGNIGMVPGLYMYKTAFVDGQFGYACALGMILAALILFITVLYQKYVKVDK